MRIILFLTFLIGLTSNAQKLEYVGDQRIVKGDFAGYDALGYGYYVAANNALMKIKNEESAQYQNLALGRIARIDLTNPLHVVIHYPDFNAVVMLDNQLNEIRTIFFSEIGDNVIATATGFASQNRLWLYDNITQRIGLYSYLGNRLQFITQPLPAPVYYETNVNSFQWINEQSQWYRCDVFGKITLVGTLPPFGQIRFISEGAAIYLSGQKLFFFTVADGKSAQIDIGTKIPESFRYSEQILSIFTADGITNYKITTP